MIFEIVLQLKLLLTADFAEIDQNLISGQKLKPEVKTWYRKFWPEFYENLILTGSNSVLNP